MTTALTSPLLLPSDLLLIPVADLPSASRAELKAADTDFAITRPRSRRASSIVDADSAALLEQFRSARTIADAVMDFSRARSVDPHAVLTGAYPMLQRLIAAQLLVPVDDPASKAIVASIEIGDRIGDLKTIRQLSLVVEGTSYAGERYEFSHFGARHTASFLAIAQPQATAIRDHWPRTGLAASRAPRVLVSAGGLLPFLLPDAYVLEQLVSYRHRCRVPLEPLADYLQVIYADEHRESIARERVRQNREAIGRWTFVADGLRDKPRVVAVEIWYRASTIPLNLPETIGAPCKQ